MAGEVRGVVDAAGSQIDGMLRVWAKRAGHVDAATFVDPGGRDGLGRLVPLAPAFERGDRLEPIGARAAAAMGHAGDHEQTKPVVLIRAHPLQDGLVIGDGIERRDRAARTSVAPTVIDEELASARLEFGEVGVDGVDFPAVEERAFGVFFEVEGSPVPGGILVGDVAVQYDSHPDLHKFGAAWQAEHQIGRAHV